MRAHDAPAAPGGGAALPLALESPQRPAGGAGYGGLAGGSGHEAEEDHDGFVSDADSLGAAAASGLAEDDHFQDVMSASGDEQHSEEAAAEGHEADAQDEEDLELAPTPEWEEDAEFPEHLAHFPDEAPDDYDDWVPRGRGSAAGAPGGVANEQEEGPQVEVLQSLLWELAETPLGYEDLASFGPNGPPMNVMDYCAVTEQVFVVNQRRLLGLPVSALQALAEGNDAAASQVLSRSVLDAQVLSAQANRLRCGRVGGCPTVVAVDAAGHVTVAQTDAERPDVLTLRNLSQQNGYATSTWGIAVAPYWAVGSEQTSEVVVSANDHCVKAWNLEDRWGTSASSSGRPPPRFEGAPLDRQRPPRVVTEHSHNVPCVDVAGGRVISASLDGSVRVALARSAAGVQPRDDEVRFRGPANSTGSDRGMWGACWVPLRSVRTAESANARRSPMAAVHVDWVVGDTVLPEEIIVDSLLPFLPASELLRTVQLCSAGHGRIAEREVVAAHRREHVALCFSASTLWLLGDCLQVHCRRRLPFDAAFAHICYAPDLSAAVMSTKLGPPASSIWVVAMVRRCRSLRFRVQLHQVKYDYPEAGHWPGGVIVGMTVAPGGRLFTMLASKRLACHQVAFKAADVQSARG